MKSHLISSQTQLTEGKNYTALCGEEVSHAKWFLFSIPPTAMTNLRTSFNPLRDCKKCWFGEIPDGLVYVMVPAQEEIEVLHDC